MATAVDPVARRQDTRSRTSSRLSIPEAWHLFSLDAPSIAALWAWFFARAMRIHLPWHAPLLLAIGTWLIYVADRILDGYRPKTQLQRRHHFHAQHRKIFLAATILAGAVLLWLIQTRMAANARAEDTILFLVALLYFVLVHRPANPTKPWLPPGATQWLSKELAVGIVFAAATAVPAWSRITDGRATLAPAVALFAALCWLNCVAIEHWESQGPKNRRGNAAKPSHSHLASSHFPQASLALAALSGIAACGAVLRHQPTLSIYLAIAAAACACFLINRHRQRISTIHLRIAADAALLTPLLFLPFLH